MSTVPLRGLAHVGIRVHDLERSLHFYRVLGFEKTAGPFGPERVTILEHPSGLEINLIVNAPEAGVPNVLMDVPVKAPGITHVALLCPDLEAAEKAIEEAGYKVKDRATFGTRAKALFVRDPDGVVIELHQPAG
jgi:lactoylglutathione lyase